MVQLDIFWQALKFSWFRRLLDTNDSWAKVLLKCLPLANNSTVNDIMFAGPSELKSWSKDISNPFWKEVLSIGATMITESSYAKPEQFALLPIMNNPLFKIGNRVIQKERFLGANRQILQVADFIHPETNTLFTRDGFMQAYNCNIAPRSYTAVTNSITRGLATLSINWDMVEAHPAPRQSMTIAIASRAKKGCSPYYRLLMCKSIQARDTSRQEEKWHNELGTTLSVPFWDNCHRFVDGIKHDNVIKYFQYQILRNMLKTNTIVCHFVAIVQEECSFGCGQRETTSHLFWGCPRVKNFWEQLKQYTLITLRIPIEYSRLHILFGVHNESPDSTQNTILLAAKKYIWMQKFRQLSPALGGFLKYLNDSLATSKMISIIKCKELEFNDRWTAIINTISNVAGDEPGEG